MIFNWIRSYIKCFDQSLKAINVCLCFITNKKNKFEFFSCERLLSNFEHSLFSFGFLKRKWNRITFVLISVYSVNKCNSFWILCIFWCCKPRSVVCSWGCQDQHSWCVLCQRKCVSWRVQGHFFGGFVWNLYLIA